MEYIRLGSTGMKVSRICLGCMSYGVAHGRWQWVLNEEQSRPYIQRSLEMGINFFDTANVYANGTSEEILGRALKDFAKRDEVIIATKVRGRMHDGSNGEGLSRKAILSEIDNSLRRLGTDYVDLYQIHRWDYETPIEETMEALNDVVRAGKVRYIGASAMYRDGYLAHPFASRGGGGSIEERTWSSRWSRTVLLEPLRGQNDDRLQD